jgi:uncharacterized repeat protein (TIGR03803 family)
VSFPRTVPAIISHVPTQAADGNLYLSTTDGTVLRIEPSGNVTTFARVPGRYLSTITGRQIGPFPSRLIQAADGHLYGVATHADQFGTVFRIAPNGTVTVLHTFNGGTDGLHPYGTLVEAADGNLYGTTSRWAFGYGQIFRITPDGAFTIVRSFSGELDAAHAMVAAGGYLYGINRKGELFRMTLGGELTTVRRSVCGVDFVYSAMLVRRSDGNFYGSCQSEAFPRGMVFSAAPDGGVAVLHTFSPGPEAFLPTTLIQAANGSLYGTTSGGGRFGAGTLFNMSTNGGLRNIHSFTPIDGGGPTALIQGADGRLYGTMLGGGVHGRGTVFRMTVSGAFSVLHHFSGDRVEEGGPTTLVQGADGNLYGTTNATVFRMTVHGTFRTIYNFRSLGVGGPIALIEGRDGYLYGMTKRSVFRLSHHGSLTVLRTFTSTEGAVVEMSPGKMFSLVHARDGYLYGTLLCAGGYIFRMDLNGRVEFLHNFGASRCTDSGYSPRIRITEAPDSSFLISLSEAVSGPPDGIYRMTSNGAVARLHAFGGTLFDSTAMVVTSNGMLYGTKGESYFGNGVVYRLNALAPLPPKLRITTMAGISRTSARLTWTPVAGASSYTIKQIGPGGETAVLATGLTGTSFDSPIGLRGGLYSYVVIAINRFGSRVSEAVSWWSTQPSRTPTVTTHVDYDGDKRADIAVYRSSTGEWLIHRSSDRQALTIPWGAPALEDRPVPADYDGDGAADVAVYRESSGEWFIRRSSDLTLLHGQWGAPGFDDLPVPADFDGDGIADLAVYRGTTGEWFVRRSTDGSRYEGTWGAPSLGDIPVPADYDGDGRADLAVYRTTTGGWFVRRSSTGTPFAASWGSPTLGDVPVPADYDGDKKADVAVYRSTTGQWFTVWTTLGYGSSVGEVISEPTSDGVPVPADFRGDGRAHRAVYERSSAEWHRELFGSAVTWGAPTIGDAVRAY